MSIALLIPTWREIEAGDTCAKAHKLCITDSVRGAWSFEHKGVLQNMVDLPIGDDDILMYMHDDVEIMEAGWDQRIIDHFAANPKCGLLGFGGAKGLGLDCLYKVPYRLNDLARLDFLSNMKDWHIHGCHTLVPQQVAMLDGFCLVFRREFYDEMGGWQSAIDKGFPSHHCYDAYACCMARRLGWEVHLLPIRCHHRGGETATKGEYIEWLQTQGWKDDSAVHASAHAVFYDEFRDLLPIRTN